MYVMTLHRTTIGKKILMAVTGLIGVGYVIMHMYGNLKAFLGPTYFNEYAEGLRTLGAPIFGHLHLLTLARLVLVAAVLLHIWAAVSLTRQAQHARPTRYAVTKRVQASPAALTMRWGGVTIFIFLIYHLAHLTWGTPLIAGDFVRGDAFHNLVTGLSFPPVALIYMAGVVALGFHLYHGAWSMFQTLGFSNENTEPPLRAFSVALAWVIVIGFLAVPVSILLGIIHE